jgi:hypothetical protein
VVEREITNNLLFTAVLAAKLVAHVDAQALHARLLAAATHIDVGAPANHRRHREFIMRRTQHAIAV